MRVVVFGLWHLGCVTAACVAEAGNEVVAIDTNTSVIEDLRQGRPPLFEPGLAELLQQNQASGRLTFSSDLSSIAETEVLWICHDTPVDEEDRADVAYVVRQASETFPYLRDGSVVLVSSQLPVGTIVKLERSFAEVARGRRVRFACSPENLRLGQALEIFRNPTRIVIGVRDTHARDILEPLLSPFSKRLIFMSVESAEMVKHAVNAFLAVSVTFANEIAAICEKVGAEATDVEKALRSEPRIGEKAYVRPGPAFAGGTLARDIRFLSSIAECAQVQAPLIESVIPSNRAHRKWAINQLRERLRPLKNRRIAVLGLSYKPGTNSMRRSAAIELLHDLAHEDVEISAFDPAVRALPKELNGKVTLTPDLASALKNSEAVVIATEWPEFRTLSEADFAAACDGCLVLDPGRYLDPTLAQAKRFRVISVGTAV